MPASFAIRLPKAAVTISLALGLLAAAAVVGFNELAYRRSADAVKDVALYDRERSTLHSLLHLMLDAETGQRGYLLTGDTAYLAPYEKAMDALVKKIAIAARLYSQTPEQASEFEALARLIERKLSEMETTVRLRSKGDEDAWKFMLTTNVGNELMAEIRARIERLIAASSRAIEQRRESIVQSLDLARVGIALTSLIALLAFFQTLWQASALAKANQRRKEELERERDLLEGLVKDRTARLAELATYLQKVREDERAHLARELHDELGSLLTAAKLDVARLKSKIGTASPELQERLKHLTEMLNSGIALKRRIIEDLRPSSLANLGLRASLDILTREFAEQSEIEVASEIEDVPLDPDTQLTVYRLVQESLTNIGKYAQAQRVAVTVRNGPRHVLVEVRDDGVGFEPGLDQARRNAHGLAGMRHRVEAAGGKLEVDSSAGAGTRISAQLPKSAGPGFIELLDVASPIVRATSAHAAGPPAK